MRPKRRCILHCSATREGAKVTVDDIYNWHIWPRDVKDASGKVLHVMYHGKKYNSRDELPDEVRNKKGRGWSDIGYHFIVDVDGVLFDGRPINIQGAHCSGHNRDSIGICYIGGLDKDRNPKDTRTEAQRATIEKLLREICDAYHIIEIKGHRDYSEDLDGDGIIEKWEWIKVCPCYNAEKEHKHLLS